MHPRASTTGDAPAPGGAPAPAPAAHPLDRDGPRDAASVEAFWAARAGELLDWFRPWDAPCAGSLEGADARWFPGARLNVAYNCLDRHLEERGERVALVWEGDAEHEVRRLTFRELHERTCRFANALKGIGVRRGDRVCLYLPAIPEAVVAMLACARIGAVHAVVYAGFSPDALGERLRDAGCSVVVTADCTMRAGRRVPLKANVDLACADAPSVRRVVVVRRDAGGAEPAPEPDPSDGRDLWYHELVQGATLDCAAVEMDATDPLFVLYTSGSAGKPKGVVHACGGYLVHVAATCRDVFGHRDDEVHWCAADLGWITAHGYAVYGPLANGTTTLLYEGVPAWPDAGRWWRIVERHAVSVLYTSPTALRGLKAFGSDALAGTDRASLRLLGTVGEPLDADTWRWYARDVGQGRCAVVDTWWQTETGGIVVASDPDEDGPDAVGDGASGDAEAGGGPRATAMRPLPGLLPELVDGTGAAIAGAGEGELVLAASWPGQATTLWDDRERYVETYLARHPGRWATGDGARRDACGRWWLTGRLDDVLELAGRRVGAARIEALLIAHPDVAEAAVVGSAEPGGRTRVQAWVRPMGGVAAGATLRAALEARVRDGLGGFAVPERIRFAPKLPKTRSGKLMRRMLRKIAERELDDLGDTSTLADPGIVDTLVADELARDGVGAG